MMTTALFSIILHCDNFRIFYIVQKYKLLYFHQFLAKTTLNIPNKIEKRICQIGKHFLNMQKFNIGT